MTTRPGISGPRTTLTLAAIACATTLGLYPALAQEAPPEVLPEQPVSLQAASTDYSQLVRLAETGRFDDLLARLNTEFNPAEDAGDTGLSNLIGQLQRHHENSQTRLERQQAAYQEKLATLKTELAAERLEKALVAAIDAHGLAEQPAGLVKNQLVIDTVAQAVARAKQAEAKRDWVTAISLYRLLNLLYETEGTYRHDLERVARHIRVLSIYVPDLLDKLYDDYAKARGENPGLDENLHIVDEHWTQRLENIDRKMLIQALVWASSRHVDHQGYKPLMLGTMASLRTLIDTDGLERTFPSLKNKEAAQRFRDHLDRTTAQLSNPQEDVKRLDAENIIDSVLLVNEQTIALPEQVLIYEMGEGATEKLDDFSSIIWPKELEQFSRSTRGAFYGVGIQISRRDNQLVVVSPLENTPAQKAGIKAGDVITTVAGRNADNWSLNRAVSEITGPEGTEVVLGIDRNGVVMEFRLTRARIIIESIRGWEHRSQADGGGWNYWIDRPAGIGYVRLSQFIPQTADDLDAAVSQLQKESLADNNELRGLILDLRFNPGGLLDSAIDVADRFIEEGPIVKTVDGFGTVTNTGKARRFGTYDPFPVIILINQGSASASEIVAGALQDYGKAMIVGTRSFGKGSVQDLFPLADRKASLKLTRQYYMLPLGAIIHRKEGAATWGIEPDLVVPMTDQQVADALELRQEVDILRDDNAPAAADQPKASELLAKGLDSQLEAALLILKTRQIAHRLALAQAAPAENPQQALLKPEKP